MDKVLVVTSLLTGSLLGVFSITDPLNVEFDIDILKKKYKRQGSLINIYTASVNPVNI